MALLRSYYPEGRELIRTALDTLVPVLPSRLPQDEFYKVVKWTKKILADDGYSMPQLCHIWHMIIRFSDVFYCYRSHLIPQMVTAITRIGLTGNAASEFRLVAVAIADLVISWELKKPEKLPIFMSLNNNGNNNNNNYNSNSSNNNNNNNNNDNNNGQSHSSSSSSSTSLISPTLPIVRKRLLSDEISLPTITNSQNTNSTQGLSSGMIGPSSGMIGPSSGSVRSQGQGQGHSQDDKEKMTSTPTMDVESNNNNNIKIKQESQSQEVNHDERMNKKSKFELSDQSIIKIEKVEKIKDEIVKAEERGMLQEVKIISSTFSSAGASVPSSVSTSSSPTNLLGEIAGIDRRQVVSTASTSFTTSSSTSAAMDTVANINTSYTNTSTDSIDTNNRKRKYYNSSTEGVDISMTGSAEIDEGKGDGEVGGRSLGQIRNQIENRTHLKAAMPNITTTSSTSIPATTSNTSSSSSSSLSSSSSSSSSGQGGSTFRQIVDKDKEKERDRDREREREKEREKEKDRESADISYTLTKDYVKVLANFVVRLCLFASDNKDPIVAKLSSRCLRLFKKLTSLPSMCSVQLPYYEKLLQNALDGFNSTITNAVSVADSSIGSGSIPSSSSSSSSIGNEKQVLAAAGAVSSSSASSSSSNPIKPTATGTSLNSTSGSSSSSSSRTPSAPQKFSDTMLSNFLDMASYSLLCKNGPNKLFEQNAYLLKDLYVPVFASENAEVHKCYKRFLKTVRWIFFWFYLSLSIYLFICLFIYFFIYLFIYLFICLFIYSLIYLFIYLFIY